jgi:hypothetical protein
MQGLPAGRFSEGYAGFAGLLRMINRRFLPNNPAAAAVASDWFALSAMPGEATLDEFFGPFARSFSRREDGVAFDAFLELKGGPGPQARPAPPGEKPNP